LTGKDLSGATDVYSLGLLVYEAASGRGPFEFGSAQEAFAAHAIDEPEKLSKRVPDVPAEMSDLVARCLAKDPTARPAASAVARTLGHIADTLGAPRATELGAVVAAAARAS
jgi:serine/threonine-protein kinase